jgi:hypothetical protein
MEDNVMLPQKTKSQRQYKRYFVRNRIFAVVRSKNHQLDRINNLSKGEIALAVIKSKPPKMGEIIEISRSGLSFSYIENDKKLSDFNEMDILFVDEDFYLRCLPFTTVNDSAVHTDSPFNALAMKKLTVCFGSLSKEQKKQLEHVLKNFTTGEVPYQILSDRQQVWGSRQQ